MSSPNSSPVKPRRRLWRTWLRRPRDLTPFAPRVAFDEVADPLPPPDEVAHWGEMILLEDYVTALHRDGTISHRSHYVSVLHGAQHLAQWDEVTWLYEPRAWKPTLRRAVLYLPDGSSRPADVSDHQIDSAGRLRQLRAVFGHLRPGAVLEFEQQEDHFRPGPVGPYHWGQFFLRTAPPCRRRRYTVAVAEPFRAEVRSHHGAGGPAESVVGDYRVYQWDLKEVGGYEWDAWTPHLRDFGPWVDFSTVPSWGPVAEHLRGDLAPCDPGSVGDLARELTRDATSPRDKAAALYRYAARELRYGRPPQETFNPASRTASKMAEDLRGDCKDKSSLLVGLLRAVGVPARVAVVLTRMQGVTPYLPARRFDHALVLADVDGRELWLDAAAGPYGFGEVPFNDQGVQALVLDDDGERYVEVPPPEPEQHGAVRECEGRLEEDGVYRFRANLTCRGDRAGGGATG